jgi:plasmid stability protein
MTKRNLTLNLPADLIRKTKLEAAEHGKSLNAFVRELIEERVSREDRTRTALDRLLALTENGPVVQGDPRSINRNELHERR